LLHRCCIGVAKALDCPSLCYTNIIMARPAKSSTSRTPPLPPSYSSQKVIKKHDDYTSDGIEDADIFLLPGSDYQVMLFVTFVAAVVRLFRIYQPSSVVFDEVQ
jgi:dolichyl-phosphate-mannose-protein mannosyltransferase